MLGITDNVDGLLGGGRDNVTQIEFSWCDHHTVIICNQPITFRKGHATEPHFVIASTGTVFTTPPWTGRKRHDPNIDFPEGGGIPHCAVYDHSRNLAIDGDLGQAVAYQGMTSGTSPIDYQHLTGADRLQCLEDQHIVFEYPYRPYRSGEPGPSTEMMEYRIQDVDCRVLIA